MACTKFIHDKGFIHRDLKHENALINDEGGLLIADFGLADCVALPGETFVPGSKDHKYLTGACGTLEYIAPEMLEEGSYAFSVDVWSIGVCAFKLLMGEVSIRWRYPIVLSDFVFRLRGTRAVTRHTQRSTATS